MRQVEGGTGVERGRNGRLETERRRNGMGKKKEVGDFRHVKEGVRLERGRNGRFKTSRHRNEGVRRGRIITLHLCRSSLR